MNKKELIDLVAQKAGITKTDAANAIDATFDAISESLVKGDGFSYTGFGNFKTRKRAERNGRNPATGNTFVIPATNIVTFKVGKNLKEDVANAKQ